MNLPARKGRLAGWAGHLSRNWRIVIVYLALAFAIFALWNNILLVPLRMLTVFVHEVSHAFAAIATGGSVLGIALAPDGSGMCVTRGGNAMVIASAGYLGSIVWGLLMLGAAERLERPWRVLMAMAVLLALVALVWVRPMAGFGFVFSVLFAAGLVWASLEGARALHATLLRLMGLTSCLYGFADLRREVFARSPAGSDATLMAEMTGLPAWLWGVVWLVLAFLIAAAFMRGMIATPPSKAGTSAHMHRISQRP